MVKCVVVKSPVKGMGKSVLITALCRIYTKKGYHVAPFQACNISSDSYFTGDGGEVGISQVLQAEAASVRPSMHMNPVLLKPQNDGGFELIIHGESLGFVNDIDSYKDLQLKAVDESFNILKDIYDIVFIESVGSSFEVDCPEADVILIGDDFSRDDFRGVDGVVINHFKEDTGIVDDVECGVPVWGVLPYSDSLILPCEGSFSMREGRLLDDSRGIVVGVIDLPEAAIFSDIDPFDFEDDVAIRMIGVHDIGACDDVDLIVIPGTRSTTDDARVLMDSGMGVKIIERSVEVPVFGICGGYQILGNSIQDKDHGDGGLEFVETLGLLDIDTDFEMSEKVVCDTRARVIGGDGLMGLAKLVFGGMGGEVICGYELHKGNTYIRGEDACPVFIVDCGLGNNQSGVFDGACGEGNVLGTYVHGIFDNHNIRGGLLNYIRACKGLELKEYDGGFVGGYCVDVLAGFVGACLDGDLWSW